jgi:anti-sigma regulatory factor (Ser/Thr protein kinase)
MSTVAAQPRLSQWDAAQPYLTLTAAHIAGIVDVRHQLAQALESRGFAASMVDTALLLATELLSNALIHTTANSGPAAVRLDVHVNGSRLVIAVTDPDPRLPGVRPAEPNAEHGRGLALVEALATRWGTRSAPARKTVWCLLT